MGVADGFEAVPGHGARAVVDGVTVAVGSARMFDALGAEMQAQADALAADGYQQTEDMEEANLVLLNTCHIREKASEKIFSELGKLRSGSALVDLQSGENLAIGGSSVTVDLPPLSGRFLLLQ